jgi:hypothetical protein
MVSLQEEGEDEKLLVTIYESPYSAWGEADLA